MPQAKHQIWNLPNGLTLARVAVIPFFCLALVEGTPTSCLWAAGLFGAASITDFFDGYLARLWGLESRLGKFLDPLADKLIVKAALICLVKLGWLWWWLAVLVLARELYINGLRSLAATDGLVIAAGWAGKAKTALQLTGLSGLLIHYQYTVYFGFYEGPVRFNIIGLALFGLSVVFSVWSAVTYTMNFARTVKSSEASA